jgi:predicted kinase
MQCNLFVFMGLIASGKSTLAKAWSQKFSFPYYNSDIVRKEIAGFTASSRQADAFHQGIYTPEMTKKTYDALLEHARKELSSGNSVILDASYSTRSAREHVLQCALDCNSKVFFVLCQCDENETRRRLQKREQDPTAVSDANWDIFQKQVLHFDYPHELPPRSLFVIDTTAPVEDLMQTLQEKISNT